MRKCRERGERGASRNGEGKRIGKAAQREKEKEAKKGRDGEGLICKVATWIVAGKAPLCCVGRGQREAC